MQYVVLEMWGFFFKFFQINSYFTTKQCIHMHICVCIKIYIYIKNCWHQFSSWNRILLYQSWGKEMSEIIYQKTMQDSSTHCQLLLFFYLKDRCVLERIFFIVLKQLALSVKKTSCWATRSSIHSHLKAGHAFSFALNFWIISALCTTHATSGLWKDSYW